MTNVEIHISHFGCPKKSSITFERISSSQKKSNFLLGSERNFFSGKSLSLLREKVKKCFCFKTPPSLHTRRGFQGDRGVTLGFHSSGWFNGVAWGWSAMIHPEICGIHEGRECHERHNPTAGVWSLGTAAQHANFFCLVGHV